MDFKKLKENVIKIKDKTKESLNKAVDYWSSKISSTKLVLSTEKDLKLFIDRSKTVTNKDWKKFKKKIIVIFIEKTDSYYKKLMYDLLVLYTKAWSQNIFLKICDISKKDLKDIEVSSYPSLVVFETKKIIKVLEWEEKIKKVVKSFTLNINKTIDSL